MSVKNGYLAIALLKAFPSRPARTRRRAPKRTPRSLARRRQRRVIPQPGRAAAAVETVDVKSALMADRTVDASQINVDTLHDTKTVVLKGSVKTATERDEAARIAAVEAPGYRIDNQLTIVPNP